MKPTANLRSYVLAIGLELKEYQVQTKDGYILPLHRLIDPKQTDDQRAQMEPILCQHGLLSSSGSFLTPGNRSLPVFLLRQGFDVWLGNNRSGFEPLHAFYTGNLMHNEEYWDWDIQDLAHYDITCLIENVLVHTPNYKKLILMGHSQGCTQSFLMLRNTELAEIHEKVGYFVGLAPAIYPGTLFHKRKFLKFMGNRSKLGFKLFFGVCCFLNVLTQSRNWFHNFPLFGNVCVLMFNYLFQWNGKLWNSNRKIWHFHFIFNVSFVSAKLISWWLSFWREESFRNELVSKETFQDGMNFRATEEPKYNVSDDKTFFPFKQQWFSESVIPMALFIGEVDNLVDGQRLACHMETFEPKYQKNENLHIFEVKHYSHLDVLWANNVIRDIGRDMVEVLQNRQAR
ncbi:alpha/beta-hydrolase [Yamadazyma tenuis ATCC 10573]|uniref:Alpha/beta-hydrolase n=2 Tax=Candida tenuis TaxID=2315449 RepID=G3BD61_CANTC|nr:alpha/beta-hydrolase [Yamadazyma tenuis ATCC 10573]EGV60248.1 alpha/beta-hydrolase [Yamadazyma tenuis ATCC 10573]